MLSDAGSGRKSVFGTRLAYELHHPDWSGGSPVIRIAFQPDPGHQGLPGLLHGGIAAAVLDEAMGAIGMVLFRQRWMTAKLELKYRQPISLTGEALVIEAWEQSSYPRIRAHRTAGRISHLGAVAVEARALFIDVPG